VTEPGAPTPAAGRPLEGLPMLGYAVPLAAFAVVTKLVAQAIGPSLPGIAVGLDKVVGAVQKLGDALSGALAVATTMMIFAAMMACRKSRVPWWFREAGVGAGAAVIVLIVLSAVTFQIADVALIVFWGAATFLALAAVAATARVRFARGAAVVVGLVAAASVLRFAGIRLGYLALTPGSSGLARLSVAAATGSFAFEAAAVLVAAASLATAARKPTSPGALVCLVLAAVGTRFAIGAPLEETGALGALLQGVAFRLLTRPTGDVGLAFRLFIALLTPLTAIASLAVLSRVPALSASIALALVACGSVETPLGSLLLVTASLILALAAHDERGMWAALTARGGSAAT
jgi:hypothetical protein